jgi:hypothetical protein
MKTCKTLILIIAFAMMHQFANAQSGGNLVSLCKCIPCSPPFTGQTRMIFVMVKHNQVNTYLAMGWQTSCPCSSPICHFRLGNEAAYESSLVSISPMPVSDYAAISFSIPEQQKVTLEIFDMNGRLITTLADEDFQAGENEIHWNASEYDSGIYFLQMKALNYSATEKISIIK